MAPPGSAWQRALTPLESTRYGRQHKPGLRYCAHLSGSGLAPLAWLTSRSARLGSNAVVKAEARAGTRIPSLSSIPVLLWLKCQRHTTNRAFTRCESWSRTAFVRSTVRWRL